MKIIHTSDWHLGRHFGPISLAEDHQRFADWLVKLTAAESADLVVIAGDLYDRAVAPNEAISLFRTTVTRLLDTGAKVAAISGNHDGADRVAPYDDFLDRSGLYIRGGYQRIGEVIPLEFEDGPLDLVLLPFLDPQAAPDDFGEAGQTEGAANEDASDASVLVERRRRRTHQSVMEVATTQARNALTAPRSLAVAHAFVTGGESTDSERQLVVGGTGEVATSVFDGFSYTALGHLHRPQRVGGDSIRYSGTPLSYSFSEEHDKSVVVIEMARGGSLGTTIVPVDVGRRVQTITGDIDDLLDPTKHPEAADRFVRAVITDRETVLDAKARLSTLYPHIVEVRLQPTADGSQIADARIDIRSLKPIEATREFWEAAEGSPPDPKIDALLVDAVTAATAEVDR